LIKKTRVEKMANELLVIGNGFDLAHEMKTRYHDFRDWLNRFAHKEYVARMEGSLNCYGEMLWANLEENTRLLKNIDYKEKFYEHSSYLTEYSSTIINLTDDFVEYDDGNRRCETVADLMRDIFNQQGFQHYLEEDFFWLYRLKSHFCEWVKSIELAKKPLYYIPQNALYLSFNYTNLLENTYKIATENILHIHGNTDREIEFGNPDITSFIYKNEDTRALGVKDEINHALRSVYKDVNSIIRKNQLFFSTLEKIQKIYILGHSMNEIDEPYFLKIKENVPSNTQWMASYYSEKDRLRAEELIFNKLGVNVFEIKKLDNILKSV